MLSIRNLHVNVGDQPILKGLNLELASGEVSAIMGPNGSGKSTLSYVVAGRPGYEITEGEILLDGKDISELSADERARAGVFLSFQYPVEVPGVPNKVFMKTAANDHLRSILEHQIHLGIPFEELDADALRQRMPIFDLSLFGPPRSMRDPKFGEPVGGELAGAVLFSHVCASADFSSSV